VCLVLFSIGALSELVSIVELCLKNRSKQTRNRNKNLNQDDDVEKEHFLSKNSVLYNFSDDSIKMASRSNQNFTDALLVKEKEHGGNHHHHDQSSDECLNLIKTESHSSLCFDSLNKSLLSNGGVNDALMAIGYESNINVIKYHPFDYQSGKFNENTHLSIMLYSK
jgi:hypothetical protein